ARFGGSVNSVVWLGKADPYDTHRIVGAGRDGCLRVAIIRIPEQSWIVMKFRLSSDTQNFPGPLRQRIVLAADGRGEARNDLSAGVESADAASRTVHHELRSVRGSRAGHIRRHDRLAGFIELFSRIQRLQRLGTAMELLS